MIGSGAPVIVGVKNLAVDFDTVRLAAREAASAGLPLCVLHAFVWPAFIASRDAYGDDRELADRMLDEAVSLALAERPGLDISAAVVDGEPIQVLLRAANDASLVVLGGNGAQPGHDPAFSVTIQVAARSSRPVLFATGAEHTGPVVVGVDGSADSVVGLDAAFDEARRRHTGVVVLHAEGVRCRAEGGDDPSAVPAEHRVVDRPADEALIAESDSAQLVVVGAQGDRPCLLGPVTQAVIRHANCPVLIARATATSPR
ncbi:universal stress protein [Actinomycetes bacterium KLBMP 9797]